MKRNLAHLFPDYNSHYRRFFLGCLFELALLVVAGVLSRLFGQPLFSSFHWNVRDVLVGWAASIPLFCGFLWFLQSTHGSLRPIRRFMKTALLPFFADWGVIELMLISVIAGVSEEILFRGVVQEKLASLMGLPPAIAVTSLLFGCVHLVTPVYGLITALIGAYLSILLLINGNLLTLVVTHAVYDAMALIYFVRIYR